MKKFLVLFLTIFCLIVIQTGCKSGGADTCEPGSTQSCLCEGEIIAVGTHICNEDGQWEECVCGAGQQDAAADGEDEENTTPTAVINADPTTGTAPMDVDFSAAVVGGEEPHTFAWDFGDGNASTEQSPGNTYSSPGTYTVILVVTDANGDTAADDIDIHVGSDDEPVVDIMANPGAGVEPLSVQFNASVAGGNEPFAYEWDFDDDGTADSEVQNPTHVFNAGTHTVSVTVTDSDGDSDTASTDIEVTEQAEMPEAVATTEDDCVLWDWGSVSVDGSGSSDPNGDSLTYMWVFVTTPEDSDVEFEDPTLQSAIFWPDEEGIYEVQLFVYDGKYRVGSNILTITASWVPGSIDTVDGNGQTAMAGDDFAELMSIIVYNECGIPLPGAMVKLNGINAWVYEGANCGGLYCTYSDMDGMIFFKTFAGYRADAPASITASLPRLCVEAVFDDLTVTPGPAAMLLMNGPVPHPKANGNDAAELSFQLYDRFLNPMTGPDVQFGLEIEWGMMDKNFNWDPNNNAWFADAGTDGVCNGRYCWNLTTENGQRNGIEVYGNTTWPVFVEVGDVKTIEEVDGGYSLGSNLFGGALYLYENDFEGSGNIEPQMNEWSQWEVGEPTGSNGPSSAHSGDNVLGTNLDGDYEVPDTFPGSTKVTQGGYGGYGGGFIFSDYVNFDFDYYEYTYMMGMWVEFWHWYDMRGSTSTCPECSAATGNVQSYYNESYYLLRKEGYPAGSPYPGPGLCWYDDSPAKDKDAPELYRGWGAQNKEWHQAHMRYYEFDYMDVYYDKQDYPHYYPYIYGNLLFAFNTSTNGEAGGAGWYIDDLRIQALAGQGALRFDNTNDAKQTDVWQQSSYDFNGVIASDAGPCYGEYEPATATVTVHDEYDNRIVESGIEVDVSFVDAGVKGYNSAEVDQVLRGSFVSQTGGVTRLATDYEGVIRFGVKNTTPGALNIKTELPGVAGTGDEDTEYIYFSYNTYLIGDCCEDPILVNNFNPTTSMTASTGESLGNYHDVEGSCSGSSDYTKPDAVFKFRVSEDGLYFFNTNVGCCSYRFEIRQGNTCPGTPIPEDQIDSNCFYSDEYAYLFAGTTYWLIIEANYSHDPGSTITVDIYRDYAGGP